MKALKHTLAGSQSWMITIVAALAAFGTYSCMYAFRKAFAAGTYEHMEYFHLNYKVLLVFAQILGYTVSKFYGIKFIAEIKAHQRIRAIWVLIGISWLALLGFALVPAPYNIPFLFLNGLPLGMIWGLVFSFLEGRRSTEFMGAVMSISLIFSSGFVKTVGRTLMHSFGVGEFWMPFVTGMVFMLPMALFIYVLSIVPPPNEEDKKSRTERKPMSAKERKSFLVKFLPGIILTIIIYVLLTVVRDIRDNFEVEIWKDLGYGKNTSIYTQIDLPISLAVLLIISLLILVKNNLKAFTLIHVMIIVGCLLVGTGTMLFNTGHISPITWMVIVGLGLYMGYIPYNAIFFERMLATYRFKGNVGFVMYLADSIGYLGSVSVLLIKEFAQKSIPWGMFFNKALLMVAVVGLLCGVLSLIYFRSRYYKSKTDQEEANLNLIAI